MFYFSTFNLQLLFCHTAARPRYPVTFPNIYSNVTIPIISAIISQLYKTLSIMSDLSNTDVIKATRYWLEHTVIGFNFCPFAKREFVRQSIRYWVSDAETIEQALEDLLKAVSELEQDTSIETTLLILPKGFADFEDYLDLLDMANELLHMQELEGVFQLASFHPEYCFEGQLKHDPANFTNRSPYPMLHLLREASIEKALEFVDDPDAIPERNVELAREKGIDVFKKVLNKSINSSG